MEEIEKFIITPAFQFMFGDQFLGTKDFGKYRNEIKLLMNLGGHSAKNRRNFPSHKHQCSRA